MVMDRLWDRIPILSILPRQDRNPIPRRHGFAHSNLAGNFHCRKVERMSGDPLLVANPSLPPWLWPRAAYVHVPFCAHHCGYCDFAVAAGADDRIDAYLDALGRELAALLDGPQPVDTLFIGGGTPTYLSARQLERLLTLVNRWLPLDRSPRSRLSGGGVRGEGAAPPEESGSRDRPDSFTRSLRSLRS